MKYLLDNDTFNHVLYGHPEIAKKVRMYQDSIWLSSVAAVESIRGVLQLITRVEDANFQPSQKLNCTVAHDYFSNKIYGISKFKLLNYDDESDLLFRALPNSAKRIGPNDCRIAASAISHGFTVVTCNTKHFAQIAEKVGWDQLRWVDWTS